VRAGPGNSAGRATFSDGGGSVGWGRAFACGVVRVGANLPDGWCWPRVALATRAATAGTSGRPFHAHEVLRRPWHSSPPPVIATLGGGDVPVLSTHLISLLASSALFCFNADWAFSLLCWRRRRRRSRSKTASRQPRRARGARC